jgi:Icc protein
LRGYATWPRFRAVVQDIAQRLPAFDLLVFTGDTAHDENRATYEAVRETLGEWTECVRIIPGNHDHRESLRAVFPLEGGMEGKRVTFVESRNDWQVIGLDAQDPGEVGGALGRRQLDWLRTHLAATAPQSTLLLLHHPPVSTQSPWLDEIGLEDAEELEKVVRDHPQVRLISCGHIHQELAASLAGATVVTTPAVGPQFRPRTEQLEFDPLPPGYRVIDLYPDGQWSTQVLRC